MDTVLKGRGSLHRRLRAEATASAGRRTWVAVAWFGRVDTEGLLKAPPAQRGDDDGVAARRPLDPAEIEAALADRDPYPTGKVSDRQLVSRLGKPPSPAWTSRVDGPDPTGFLRTAVPRKVRLPNELRGSRSKADVSNCLVVEFPYMAARSFPVRTNR